jgi:predicted acetyltransferase
MLPSYISALQAGWSPDNVRKEVAAREQLQAIKVNAVAFVDGLDDPSASGGPIPLPDGSTVARLPSIVRWIWDGDVCGAIGFRWQAELLNCRRMYSDISASQSCRGREATATPGRRSI